MSRSSNNDREELAAFVSCILQNWFGLQAAISHGMGGAPQQTAMKVSQMIETITDMCCASDTGKEDLSDTLEDLTDEFFDTEFEDGSVDEIATILWNHKQDWLLGNKESIRSYVAAKQENNCKKLLEKLDECNEKMDTDEETTSESISTVQSTSSTPQPSEDPDGWTVPRHNRKRNR